METRLIKDVFCLYKGGKLSNFAFVSELSKVIHSENQFEIVLEDRLSKVSHNSYVYMVVPYIKKGSTKLIITMDDMLIRNLLSFEMMDDIILAINKAVKVVPYEYSAYISNIKGREIPKSEALKLMLDLGKHCLELIPEETRSKLEADKSISIETLKSVIADIDNDVKYASVLEKVQINNLLPISVLSYINKLLPMDLNCGDESKDVVEATVNAYFDYIIASTTSKADPYPSYKIEDKVYYEDIDWEEVKKESDEIMTEAAGHRSSIKAKWLKFSVNFLTSGKLTSILNKVYNGVKNDPQISKDEKLVAAAEKYNPAEMNTKGKRRLLKELIDLVPPEKLRIFEKKAKEIKDASDAEAQQAKEGKSPIKESVLYEVAGVDDATALTVALSPWAIAGVAAIATSGVFLACIISAAISKLVTSAKINYRDHGSVFGERA